MGKEPTSAPACTPAKTPSSSTKQQSILGFFSKASQPKPKANASSPASATLSTSKADTDKKPSTCLKETTKANSLSFAKRPSNITPIPSSDAAEPLSSQENVDVMAIDSKVPSDSLPSPKSPAELDNQPATTPTVLASSSPSRKVRLNALHFHHT
jgi:DNA mismatch repair protein MSH6